MSRILSIIRDNNSTFYDYRSNAPKKIRGRIFAFVIASVLLAFVVVDELNDLLDGIITVQAILIGFSFSVMFFLVSDGVKDNDKFDSIESKILSQRLARLSKEIFYNISYFNMIAMVSLAAAVLLLIPNASEHIGVIGESLPRIDSNRVVRVYEEVRAVVGFVVRALLIFTMLESGYTFARSVSRVNYLFEQKMPAADRV